MGYVLRAETNASMHGLLNSIERTSARVRGQGQLHTDRQQFPEMRRVFKLRLRVFAPNALHHHGQVLQLHTASTLVAIRHIENMRMAAMLLHTFWATAALPPRVESSIAELS